MGLDRKEMCVALKRGHIAFSRSCVAGALKVTGSRKIDLLLFVFLPEIQLEGDRQRARIKRFCS